MSFRKILEQTPVSSIVEKHELVSFDTSLSLSECFAKLAEHEILSAPVYDKNSEKWIGFVDIRDMVAILVEVIEETKINDLVDVVENLLKNQKSTFLGLDHRSTIVEKIIQFSNFQEDYTTAQIASRHPFLPVTKDTSLYELFKLLTEAKIEGGLKRVPVVEDNKIIGIVSQSSLVAFVKNHLHQFKFGPKHVKDVEIGTSPVLCLKGADSVLNLLKMLSDTKVTGVGVLNDAGELEGNVSARDLKVFLKAFDPRLLLGTIHHFVTTVRDEDINERSPTISVTENTTFFLTIERMVATKVHRIFVITETRKPVKVISLSDILKKSLE